MLSRSKGARARRHTVRALRRTGVSRLPAQSATPISSASPVVRVYTSIRRNEKPPVEIDLWPHVTSFPSDRIISKVRLGDPRRLRSGLSPQTCVKDRTEEISPEISEHPWHICDPEDGARSHPCADYASPLN